MNDYMERLHPMMKYGNYIEVYNNVMWPQKETTEISYCLDRLRDVQFVYAISDRMKGGESRSEKRKKMADLKRGGVGGAGTPTRPLPRPPPPPLPPPLSSDLPFSKNKSQKPFLCNYIFLYVIETNVYKCIFPFDEDLYHCLHGND